ncbi:MAG: hypothetical protein MZV63_11485 [Marinilabiliales bacterium]|nr:hypothetical protein [Marinilabiliales bacterium]
MTPRDARLLNSRTTADTVRRSVMYSEGMPVVKDMPGIVAARVHNALFLSPELNLNKLIDPTFPSSAWRTSARISFAARFPSLSSTATEPNRTCSDRADAVMKCTDDLEYLAETTYLLRRNSDAFLDTTWTPLVKSAADRVYVNRWTAGRQNCFYRSEHGLPGI